MKNILITGAAGFIGFHTSLQLLKTGYRVVGVDCISDYYNPLLKKKRLTILKKNENFEFFKLDLSRPQQIINLCKQQKKGKEFDQIIHLAAQAGVRYSLENPFSYVDANVTGTVSVFEAAKICGIKKVVYASSSSVYGNSKKTKFSETDRTDNPISPYAATKKSTELIASTYNHLYGINVVGLRFFTVYGPWGRPDMAPFKFTQMINVGKKIPVYGKGLLERDYTYIDDIVGGIMGAIKYKKKGTYVFNLGGNKTHSVLALIQAIESGMGKKAKMNIMGKQAGDVDRTSANIAAAKRELGYSPKTKLVDGIEKHSQWFLENREWLKDL